MTLADAVPLPIVRTRDLRSRELEDPQADTRGYVGNGGVVHRGVVQIEVLQSRRTFVRTVGVGQSLQVRRPKVE